MLAASTVVLAILVIPIALQASVLPEPYVRLINSMPPSRLGVLCAATALTFAATNGCRRCTALPLVAAGIVIAPLMVRQALLAPLQAWIGGWPLRDVNAFSSTTCAVISGLWTMCLSHVLLREHGVTPKTSFNVLPVVKGRVASWAVPGALACAAVAGGALVVAWRTGAHVAPLPAAEAVATWMDGRRFHAATAAVLWHGFVVAPIMEETVFRAGLQRQFRAHLGAIPALALATTMFAFCHRELGPFQFVAGALLAMVHERTRALAPCVVVHALINVASHVVPLATDLAATVAATIS